jgi:hypothetical protein
MRARGDWKGSGDTVGEKAHRQRGGGAGGVGGERDEGREGLRGRESWREPDKERE